MVLGNSRGESIAFLHTNHGLTVVLVSVNNYALVKMKALETDFIQKEKQRSGGNVNISGGDLTSRALRRALGNTAHEY